MPPRKAQNRKRQRKTDYLECIDNKYYIFCEGEKTEPIYFEGFESAIKTNPMYENAVHIEVKGAGCETLRVIYAAENYVQKEKIRNAEIWCVYDKDSFPAADFNEVATYAEKLNREQAKVKYYVAWSNQCIEYWFLLHFAWYTSDNDRKYYRQYLHEKFREFGYVRYEKNNSELFDILTWKGDPKKAIKYAKRRLEECKGKTDAESKPATKVHLLVERLAVYLPNELKERYI